MIKKTVKKAAKNNVIPLPKKPTKRNNITLDTDKTTGEYIKNLEYYKKDLERFFTIDDVLLLVPNHIKRRTWVCWREINKDLPRHEKIGPEYTIRGQKIYRIKAIWVLRYIKGLNWEPEVQVQVSATQSDDMQLRSSKGL